MEAIFFLYLFMLLYVFNFLIKKTSNFLNVNWAFLLYILSFGYMLTKLTVYTVISVIINRPQWLT